MQVKFSEDVIPLSDLKINPGKVVSRAQDTHRPILLTSRGRGIAVVQGLEDYERTAEELRFVKALAQGLMDVREGNTVSLEAAKKTLGIRAKCKEARRYPSKPMTY
ncbi:MAG: prevent-host-death family protein [Alteromonadaceae bacterium]|nr:prevent-host-death family protein [Alteromonadaceae bacterium]|tara:strand:- start:2538 stop:2855 length:318 start_codon:yes stop_codon:yes gene_type:complete